MSTPLAPTLEGVSEEPCKERRDKPVRRKEWESPTSKG
jgi:hypothetical protein